MTESHRYQGTSLLSLLIFTAVLGTYQPASANPCTKFRVSKIYSDSIELYQVKGTEITQVKKLKTSEITPPLQLEDCPQLPHYYIWRERGPYLVEKAKFKCVATNVAGVDQRQRAAGPPGSGQTRVTCD